MSETARALPPAGPVVALIAAAALAPAACEDPKMFEVDSAVTFATARLAQAERPGSLAMIAMQDTLQMGGTPVDYLFAGLSPKDTFTSYEWAAPTHPWTVVIREEPGAWVVEGYGEKTGKPFRTERVKFAPATAAPPP